jgi:DNA-binding transcriptional ArsR family regulator
VSAPEPNLEEFDEIQREQALKDPLVAQVSDRLKRKRKYNVEALADDLDVSPRRIRTALAAMREAGFRIPDEVGGHIELVKIPPTSDEPHKLPLALLEGERVRFGVVSDTHLASKECALPELNLAYDYFVQQEIADVFHPGDFTAGVGIFPGQHNEITHHTYDSGVSAPTL